MRRVLIAAFSIAAIVMLGGGLRAASTGVGAVQQTVIGRASFFAEVGHVPSLINFEDQPPNAPLAPSAYAARGVTIEQLDGFPIYVGEWRYPESAMVVPSGTKAISSSWSGAGRPGFSQVCNTPPDCVLFFNDGASDRIRFTFTVPASAAGIHLGQNDVAGTRVTWYDTAGSLIASQNFPAYQPWSDFVALVNASRPIGSMVVENAANNGDAVYFDDLMFVPVTARASDERPFWTEAAPLNDARYGHTTTLLNDGRVLVVGGTDGAGTPLASAELYDPALNRWTSVPSMTVARSGHGAALLGNGLVLVTGGSTVTTTTNTAELYDPVANAWRSAGTMAFPRSVHSETSLADGRVLIAGGYTPNTDPYQAYASSAELYDPVTNTWTSTGSMQTRRPAHTAALLGDGRVLVAGGANYAEYVDTAEIFSPATGTWTPAGAMSDRRYGAAAVTRLDGTVLVIGGANFFGRLATTAIFNPAGGWTAGPVMQSARFAPMAVAMGDQKILVAGGHAGASLVSAEMLDPAASPGQWTPVASLHTARYAAGSAVLLQDGGVLVAGGYDLPAGTTVSSAEIWNSGRTITALTLDRATATVGGVVSLTARLTAFGSPVSGRLVLFALNGTAAGTATTDANGVAALSGVSVPNLAPGSYPRAVSASVDGDSTSTPSAATADLTIADANRAPVAAAAATPNPAEATSAAGAVVAIDASASSDPDGDALTYRWSEETQVLATTATAPVTLSRGTHTVLLTVTDTNGKNTQTSLSITVRDTTAPAVAISASPLLGSAGWYGATLPATAVTVTIAATDGGAGVGAINYSASGAQTVGATSSAAPVGGPRTFSVPLNISAEGASTIAATAKDVAGNESASSTFRVRIDRTAPTVTITEPRQGVIYRTNSAQRHAFTCADALAGIVSCDSPSAGGEFFDTFTAGTKTFSVTATDNAGNQATRAVTYTVNTAPIAVATARFNPAEATSLTGGGVDLSGAASSDVDGSVVAYQWFENGVQIATGPSASLYSSIGTHTFELVVTDDLGGTSSAAVTVTVRDSTPPAITNMPGDLVLEATNSIGASAFWHTPTATDLVDGSVPVSCTPPPLTLFSLRAVATVTCRATDRVGNTSTATFTVTVRDTSAPVIANVPGDIRLEATSASGAIASWPAPTASDLYDGPVAVACDRASGSTFALGSTNVTCSVVDRAGNRSAAAFKVMVVDTTPPALALPAFTPVEATEPDGARVSFNVSATDAVSGTVPVSCASWSGVLFSVGSTTFECAATDAAGNRASGNVTVTVRDTTRPGVTVVSPNIDTVPVGASQVVQVDVTDAVGVERVIINGIPASRISGSKQMGRWSAAIPVSLPVPFGGALTFGALAFDARGNVGVGTVSVDADGISWAIDQGGGFSNEFFAPWGTALGRIVDRGGGGWTVLVQPSTGGRVTLGLAAGSGQATGLVRTSVCTGSYKEVWLDRIGETAEISCAATGSVTVTALRASPQIEVRKLVRSGLLGRYTYWTQLDVKTGVTVSTGSPASSDPSNTEPVNVKMLRIDEDGTETVIGTMVLDPGESADVDFVADPNGGDDRVQIVGLSGDVEVTITGSTFTIHAGETKTPVVDRTPPSIASVTASVPVIWPPDGNMVAETIAVGVTDNVDAAPACKVTGVTSNEPVAAAGDWTITGDLTLALRADRLGSGTGRLYTIGVSCTDTAGNTSTATASVSVPHDQGKK
jgi:N-acetylneuraminic acid mutarotase